MQNNIELLKEIKKGQTGTGFLIERDGYVSFNNTNNEITLKEDIATENNEWNIPYPFIVDAVLQKCEIPNANGRIYPKDILQREAQKYMEKIQDRRGYGECYPEDTLILTEEGWKELKDVNDGENILTLNPETKNIEIKPIKKKISYDYDGEMIRIKAKHINDLVTPNHKFHLFDRVHKYRGSFTANEIADNSERFNKFYIPKRGNWVNKSEEFFHIPSMNKSDLPKNLKKDLKEKYTEELILPIKPFMAFMGVYLAEEHYRKPKSKQGYGVFITQKKENVIIEIENMLIELGLYFTKEIKKDGTHTFYIPDARLNKYISQFGDCYHKYVPIEIKNQSKDLLRTFYDWFVLGDGRKRSTADDVFSTSKQLALDLNEIQLKIGYSGHFHMEDRKKDRYIKENGVNRLIKAENSQDMYFSLRSMSNGVYLDNRMVNYSKEPYKGKVACVEVDNHIWYCMSNGFSHWTGNCNHPADVIVDLDRLSHNIIDLKWEGNTLMGKLEILMSPGYIKSGVISCVGDKMANYLYFNKIKLGISSRGVGSVEKQKFSDKLIVQPDFELVCWDLVSDPSTPGAWLALDKNELTPYLESNKNLNNKELVLEKLNTLINKKNIL